MFSPPLKKSIVFLKYALKMDLVKGEWFDLYKSFTQSNVIILTLVPLLTPIATACGIDTIQLAVIVFVSIGIGSITPPMATCLMACSRVCDVPIHKLIKPILPFLLFGALPILLLVSFVPVVSTWLPGLFYSF